MSNYDATFQVPSSYEKNWLAIAGTFYMRFTQPYKIIDDFFFLYELAIVAMIFTNQYKEV